MQGFADSALHGAGNGLSWTRDRNFVLVRSSSDVVPAAFYLFDRANSRIEWWADAQPELKPERLSKMRPVRYRARDGLEIPAFITMPRDKPSKAPLVVLVHDGPWQRHADWSFDAGVQYLASLGYAVLQPNFRGTLGYGYKHFRSSFKQWGRAMQDDISDGIAWALAEGYADKSRVCIVGTGYGGYAALMGLVTSPDLFRCGAAVNALTDIATYIDSPSSPLSRSDMAQYTLREMIGDPASERTDLAKVSPLEQAARIKGAVLLAASPNHVFIPIDHSARMRSALERAGAKPVWLELDGNALGTTRSAKSFHEALARFLADNMAQRN